MNIKAIDQGTCFIYISLPNFLLLRKFLVNKTETTQNKKIIPILIYK